MDDSMEKTSSSLANVEMKPKGTGGCVGIFFQLFDWNRRFSKKKLFSKKLLPPVRLKQSSKKNGGDEKHSKHRLIADENSGGFPNMKKNGGLTNVDLERKHEMRAPGLVARLMGLESMPVLQRQKSKIVQVSGYGSYKPEKFVDNEREHEGGVLNAEISGSKHELMPQNLQKTSFNERLPLTPFGAETQPLKNVLFKSKKHYPKLPTPVKSPRNLSKKNASKLMGAATRILEPGLQTSRSKSSLTYSNTWHHSPKRRSVLDKECFEQVPDALSNRREDSATFASVALKGHPSCPNCGRCMDNLGSRTCVSEQPLIFNSPPSHCVGLSGQGSEKTKLGEPTFYQKLEDELPEDYPLATAPFTGYERPCVWHNPEKSSFSGQVCEPWMNEPLSCSSNHKTQNQNQISRLRNSVSARSKLNSLSRDKVSSSDSSSETSNFASSNQSSSDLTRSRSHVGMGNGKFEPERCIVNRQNDLVLQGRKRRSNNISRQGESCSGLSSTTNKHTCLPHSMSGNDMGANVHSDNLQRSRPELLGIQERRVGRDHTAVSFRFNSPSNPKPRFPAVTKRRVQNYSANGDDSWGLNENDLRKRFEKPLPLRGDALGIVLEQKFNELTCQRDNVGGNEAKKTTAMILQELITALTSEIPFQLDKSSVMSERETSSLGHLSCSKSSTSYQANTVKVKRSVDQLVESDRLSPGSVLEAYSSDASLSSSQGDTFENLDSLASTNTANTSKQLVANIINNVSEIFRCLTLANCGLKGTKLDHANAVILNAELAIVNVVPTGSVVQINFSIRHLLVEDLETLATLLWMNFGCSLGVEDSKETNQLRTFALDSVIEYLDSRFGRRYLDLGTTLSQQLPLCLNTDTVFSDIVEDVRKWEESSRFAFDDLMEREISCSATEWTRFGTERFETAVEISRHLLHNLVEEIVVDP